ncbi:F-box/FBD/LRR-repeat protein At1g13570-like [Bidens hawaiensis]|uniref:F-box/FBD/LRR-repeat protein At1g13570-like n=1 Tax=Bidens hawaiensis TaxID=980011 RepID=UPI00404AF82A
MKAKPLPEDIITTLPQTIIETILCLVPIDEATRTSVLSMEWRYKWTTIPKLFFSTPSWDQMMETSKLLSAIHHVMSLRNDPIQEFTLRINDEIHFSKFGDEVDQIILDLSRFHKVKNLTLQFDEYRDGSIFNLPFSVFSLHHLTELDLSWCGLDHQPTFDGFGSLTTLSLHCVNISRKTLLHLLSNCPSLKSFSLLMIEEGIIGPERSTMIELFECLPRIEHLTVRSDITQWFVPDLVPHELPISLIHLKHFSLEEMSFYNDGYGLTFLAILIKNSPNLEEIELEVQSGFFSNEEYHWGIWLEYLKDVWLEHLIELTIFHFSNLEPELKFVKFILARSPKLKTVSIVTEVEESEILQTLLHAPRASAVEIDVWSPEGSEASEGSP